VALIWFLAAAGLAIAEIFTGTFVLLMLAAGALAAALAGGLGAPIYVQTVVFAVVSTLALVAVRPVLRRHLHRGSTLLPMGVAAIEGSTGVVLEEVDAEHGLVKIDGETWRARAYDVNQVIQVGERVRIIQIEGATALVWRG
jgi:membrane protein implicated in regulation of membrane protease activity